MKVLVIQGALTAYFRLLLERLNQAEDVEIGLVIPLAKGMTAGSGVEADDTKASFTVYRLPEYKAWYGKAFFAGFEAVTTEFKPDIILAGYPYFMYFLFDKALFRRLKKKNVRFIYRDIPWNIPYYGKAVAYFKAGNNRTEEDALAGDGSRKNSLVELVKFLLLTQVRKRYLHLADAHLYYTKEARDLIGSYGIKQESIFISANSPDTDILLGIRDELLAEAHAPVLKPTRIIHVGRLVRWKRVDLILTALALLSQRLPELEFLVAGYGPEEENLRRQCEELHLTEQVKFLGGVYDPRELGRHLMSSGVYVLAGMGGLSINDAMCFAKPVICSEADGTERRLVRQGFNGYYFESGNADALAAKIYNLVSDPEKLECFGMRSLEIIKNEINIHTVLKEYLAAFNFALSLN